MSIFFLNGEQHWQRMLMTWSINKAALYDNGLWMLQLWKEKFTIFEKKSLDSMYHTHSCNRNRFPFAFVLFAHRNLDWFFILIKFYELSYKGALIFTKSQYTKSPLKNSMFFFSSAIIKLYFWMMENLFLKRFYINTFFFKNWLLQRYMQETECWCLLNSLSKI